MLATVVSPAQSALALDGPDAPAQLNFTAKIDVGEQSACTGALVAPQWVLTAATCFAADGKPAAGKPAVPTTVTVGRVDVTQTGGSVQRAVELVPHADRDLVLVRLATRITDIAPVRIAATPAAQGEKLTKAGFGRTRTEWTSDRLHTGAFTVTSSAATTLNVDPSDTATVCKGDAGGPSLRTVNGVTELVSVTSRAWQGGCLGIDAAETRTGAVDTRADGLASWVTSATQRPVVFKGGETLRPGDELESENAKLVMQADGNLVLYHITGGTGRNAALWASNTGGKPGAFATMQADGNFVVYAKDGKVGDASAALWASGTHNNAGARLELQGDANLVVYTKDGGHGIGGHLWHSDTYPRGSQLASGAKLMPGWWLTNGKQALIMDIQGNVLVREIATGRELWGRYTWDWYSYLHMQADGNLVLYKKGTGNGTGGIWSSATWGGAGSYATLDTNGSVTVRWKEGGPRWGSLSLRGAQSNRCLDFNGTNATIWDCWGGANQQWDYTPAKELRLAGNTCLTAEPGVPQTSRLQVLPCDGRAEQKWNYDGVTITSAVKPDQCVNVFSEATANGSAVGMWACGNGANAKWARL
ncbi:trypsin-like serine protease [Streptomyces sp. NPDC096079]|uniref:trypsin-like serine protease n=1 Tax=Streptomyces sp. NPDC096079 TaxID=3155820 RepID=UPI0033258F6D